MLGTFQQSHLRIEMDASAVQLEASLMQPEQLRQWLWPQILSATLPRELQRGMEFGSWLGPIEVQHHVESVSPQHIRFLLSKGIDGVHEWSWGEGWVQSCLEGISLLPLNVGQMLTLLRLRAFLDHQKYANKTSLG